MYSSRDFFPLIETIARYQAVPFLTGAVSMVSALGVDFDLHLERFDIDDCRGINLRWHNRTGKLAYFCNICQKCIRMSLS
jgi:hypothetical protein